MPLPYGQAVCKISVGYQPVWTSHLDYTVLIFKEHDLIVESNIRSFRSMRRLYDAKMLFKLVTQCDNFSLISRLTSPSVFFLRFPGRIAFTDLSRKKVGLNSFINCAKKIYRSIPLEWLDMSPDRFNTNLKRALPIC